MEMNEWINCRVPGIVDNLEKNIRSGVHIEDDSGLNLSGRKVIYDALDGLLSVLFPGVYSKERIASDDMNFYLGDVVRHVSFDIVKLVREVLHYHCPKKGDCNDCDCGVRAVEAAQNLIETLPELRRILDIDIEAAYQGDPASASMSEIVLSYPCIEAIATYRIANTLYKMDIPLIPRIMTERAHSQTGVDIHPGARIGKKFFIDHGTGVVIGETSTIGDNVKIYQGVTIGAVSPFDKTGKAKRGEKRHPDIEDDVIIYANAAILGGDTVIGKGAVIGGNTWITKSVPPKAVVYNSNKAVMRKNAV